MNKHFLFSAFLSLLLLSACSNHTEAPKNLAKCLGGNQQVALSQYGYQQEQVTKLDMEAEENIAPRCVAAWRKAVAGDYTQAMADLKALDKQYPKVPTIRFMMGQVLERSGKKKEAIAYYKDSVAQFEFSSIHLYKLAEAMRTTGDAKGSIGQYRKLLQTAPDFTPGKIGLAKALLALDPHSSEAKTELKSVLNAEPNNKEASTLLIKL